MTSDIRLVLIKTSWFFCLLFEFLRRVEVGQRYEIYRIENGGAQNGDVWNRSVCVGSLENLDLRKLKVENSPGKVTQGQSRWRGDQWIVGRREKVFMGWNFGNYKVEWKVRLGWQQRKLATNGKRKNDGNGRPINRLQHPSRRWRQRAEPQTKGKTARKRYSRLMETENQETERTKAKARIKN